MKPAKPKYRFTSYLKEGHAEPIYCVQFNPFVSYYMFASVGSNRATVYKINDDLIEPVLCFADPNREEKFSCCAWAVDLVQRKTVLTMAGELGIIRIISPSCPQSTKYLSGHCGAINEIKVSPTYQELALTASKDHSLRLWNIRTETCIAIFGGVEGHRDQVLSCDFHLSGTKITSCGMDHSVKIWDFTPDVMSAIEYSRDFDDLKSKLSFPTVRKHFPTFSTRDIHSNYIDCVAWYGNLIISKSCDNSAVCWQPANGLPSKYTSNTKCSRLHDFLISDCDQIWFLKFSFAQHQNLMALGNRVGKVYIFDLESFDHDSKLDGRYTLTHPKCRGHIRQTSFSNDGKILLACSEDATIWRWDLPDDKTENKCFR